jgi:hypothetical protein
MVAAEITRDECALRAELLRVRGYQPEHADLPDPYTSPYFDALPRLWSARSGQLRIRLAEALFPRTAAGPELLAGLDAFVARGRSIRPGAGAAGAP